MVERSTDTPNIETGGVEEIIGARGIFEGTSPVVTGEDVTLERYHCDKCGKTWKEAKTKAWHGELPAGTDTSD